jgi:hypothetical protein
MKEPEQPKKETMENIIYYCKTFCNGEEHMYPSVDSPLKQPLEAALKSKYPDYG